MSKVLEVIAEYEQTPESYGLELGLSFSEMVLQRLDELGWTQKRLAEESGMKQAFISRLVHSDANWTRDTAGRMLHALGIRARFHRHPPVAWNTIVRTDGTNCWQAAEATTYGEDIELQEKAATRGILKLRQASG